MTTVLFHVTPAGTVHDVPHCSSADAKEWTDTLCGYSAVGQRPNPTYVVLSEFVDADPFAIGCASAFPRVAHIVGVGAKVEMLWIDAGSVVAMVQDHQASRDWSIGERPRHPVRRNQLPVEKEHPVARSLGSTVLPSRTGPFPAVSKPRAVLVNLGPEAFHRTILALAFH